MAIYRKIDTRIWNDEKFMSLSDDGKLVFLFLLTHPNMTSLGAMRGVPEALSYELGWLPERLSKAFRESSERGMCRHDGKTFILIPNFIKYNKPESPNVVKAWGKAFEALPECTMKTELYHNIRSLSLSLSKGFQKAFREAFAKTLLNQEQEHIEEEEPPIAPQGAKQKASLKPKTRKSALPNNFQPSEANRTFSSENHLDLFFELGQFTNHAIANGKAFVDWQAAFRTWLGNAVKFGGSKVDEAPTPPKLKVLN